MKVHDIAAARARRPARPDRQDDAASFGKVYEIETARRARSARIPRAVREEIQAADALYERLQQEGREIRFTQVGGHVMASLCELDGTVVRPLSLLDLVELDVDPETAA